jgi:SAM-dependent methyltransferase
MCVLDAGCGSGFFSRYFISRGGRTTALDYSAEALAITRKTTDGKAEAYLQLDLLDSLEMQKHAGRFDLVFSDGLFEHFEPQEQARIMAHLRQSLRSGGLIVTIVPNRWSLWEVIRPLFMPGIREVPFTPGALRKLYRDNGMNLVESGGLNVLPIRFSPEWAGPLFGMLLYAIGGRAAP